ncbi:hypothetical protein ABB37_04521 [Leptomonas pyrrhocoris]|uniref:Sulfite exporter TauE/SafE n=1 Tax=Leptomonas pyrrhocoris TaxID=157538 RepID=A0A0M9G2Z3_LEPPY|nr:hypothetical protein ABB37_04521 [Leptomonas pyrrhocoris]KPA81183.1 hypothetical protein ABB37_04521 [Leptomonas pyrrhocoris]|eukprot:XP_015659622.1 hypothetical protein ABB37_04521 [Leptomonas pyrrhocoris]
MATPIVVFVTLGIFNFISSIIQGVAGIGDAIFMQVLWFLATGLWPEAFSNTPLGTEPVRVVALIMYVRLLFMSPLVVYLGLNDSIFSRSMTIMMAVPSTILSIIGVLLFKKLNGAVLKQVLGITSFIFAIAYLCIIIYRKWRKTRQVQELRARHVKLVVEADALAEEAQRSLNTSIVHMQSSFVLNAPNNSIFVSHPPNPSGAAGGQPNMAALARNMPFISQSIQSSLPDHHLEMPGATVIAENTQAIVVDARTGLPADTTEAFLSTIGGEVFVAPETQEPHVNEENVPPLTPSKISPSRTMTYTRVRINRNIDANGKIKMNTKIGAAVAASVAGIMASLTGVNAPPQIIFILLYDAPNYIVRVNFSAQSIPSNVIRFFMAVAQGSFMWEMAPLLIDVVVFGFAGVFVGNKIGRLLGPRSFNVFVLCLLLLCSLAMMGHYEKLLIAATGLTVVITVVCGYLENKKNKPIVEKQRLSELEVEKRLYDCLEELQRNNSSFAARTASSPTMSLEYMQRATRPKPMWGGTNFDNDDESNNAAAVKEAGHGVSTADGEDRGLLYGEGEAGEAEKTLHSTTLPPSSAAHTAADGGLNAGDAPHKHVTVTRPDEKTAAHATPAASASPPAAAAAAAIRPVEETDVRTVPAVLDAVSGQNGIISVHSSTMSSSGSGGSYGGAARRPTAAPPAAETGAEQLYRPERQSPSLRSLNSSVQNMPSDDDGVQSR